MGVHAAALAVHASAVAFVRVHAGSAAQPGGAARLGSCARFEDGARPAPRRPRRVPGPEGPKARSYMPVLGRAGHSEERTEPRGRQGADPPPDEARSTGGATLADRVLPGRRRSALQADLARAARRGGGRRKQQQAKDAVQALLPIGIGAEGGNFSSTTATRSPGSFARREHPKVLKEQARLLDQIMDKTHAPCWAPDPSSGKGGASSSDRPGGCRRDDHDRPGAAAGTPETAVGGSALLADPPTVVYLGHFFVWPMIQGFGLALRDERQLDRARSRRCGTTPPSPRR